MVPVDALTQAAAVATALLTLYGGWRVLNRRWVTPLRVRISTLTDNINSIPDVQTGLAAVRNDLSVLKREVTPNHGSSLRDVVDRIEHAMAVRDFAHNSFLSEIGISTFISGPDGRIASVNREFCRLTGRTEQESLGDRWINSIPEEDRQRVVGSWRLAVRDKRDWTLKNARIQPETGDPINVRIFAFAVWGKDKKFEGHHGFIRRVRSIDPDLENANDLFETE